MFVQLICDDSAKLIREFVFYSVYLIFLINMLGLPLLKYKKGITINDAFQRILDEYGQKANKND